MQAEFVIAEIVQSVPCYANQTMSTREVLTCRRHNYGKLGVKSIEAVVMFSVES